MGCTTVPQGPTIALSGETYAKNNNYNDVMGAVWRTAAEANHCKYISSIHREVVEQSAEIQRGEYGSLVNGTVRERWTVVACGITTEMEVRLTGVGSGVIWNVGKWRGHIE